MGRNSGKKFEVAFERFMVTNLGIRETYRNELVNGKVAARPFECDIHGVSYSQSWRLLRYVALVVLIVGVIVIFLPGLFGDTAESIKDAGHQVEVAIQSSTGYSFEGLGVALLGVVLLTFAMFGKRHTTRHIWVECKDRKTTIKRTDIFKLTSGADDVRANEQAKWRPDALWFATSSTFDVDALNFAREAGVRCFQVESSTGEGRRPTVTEV